MRVVRELTESRSKLVAGKSIMAERFAELQAEYLKVSDGRAPSPSCGCSMLSRPACVRPVGDTCIPPRGWRVLCSTRFLLCRCSHGQ